MAQPMMQSCFEKPKPPSPITQVKLEQPKEDTSFLQEQKVISPSPLRFWVKGFVLVGKIAPSGRNCIRIPIIISLTLFLC